MNESSRESVDLRVSLADAQVLRYTSDGDLVVEINLWDERLLRLRFLDPLAMEDRGVFDIDELQVERGMNAIMARALSDEELGVSSQGDYVTYFLVNWGSDRMIVVARGVEHEVVPYCDRTDL